MSGKRGRPSKAEENLDTRQILIDTAVALIRKYGADHITVRSVCEEAGLSIGTFYHHFKNKDDLLIYFVRETSFDRFILGTPLQDIAGRVVDLYMHLISRYLEMGEEFMKHFYTNAVHMWKVDPAFRELAAEQEYYCLPHLTRFVAAAEAKLLGKKAFQEFLTEILPVSRRYAETLRDDADAFCLSFDHRNAGKPLGEAARTSIERTVAFIDGAERTR